MLKRLFPVLLSFVSISASAANVATIRMDDEHLQLKRPDGKSPRTYVISPGDALELDASGYRLAVPGAAAGKQANSIQLVLGKTEQYSAPWKPGTVRYLLNGSTLQPNPGSLPYKGIARGTTGIIAVGHMESGNFSVYWVGMFKVQ